MGADEKVPRRWRFTLGQMMMAILCAALCAAIVLAELVCREGYLLPTVVFFLLAYLLAWVIIYAPIKELLFGEGGQGAGSDAGEDETTLS